MSLIRVVHETDYSLKEKYMLMVIVGLVVGVGGFQLGNYLLSETVKTLAVFLGGLFCGSGIATHPKTQAIAKQVEDELNKRFSKKTDE